MYKFFLTIPLIITCVFFASAQSISQSNQASLYSDLDNSEISEYLNFTSDILLSNAEQPPALQRHSQQTACADNPPVRGVYRCRIEATSGSRTFRVELEIPQSFGKRTVNRIAAVLESVVLQRMVEGTSEKFVARADHFGLTSRRSRKRKFRPTLPYLNPRPRTLNRQIREEAAVVEAAVESVFLASGDARGRRLKINNYNVAGKAGAATPNSYYTQRYIEISVNHGLLTRLNVSDNRWGGVIAHEILHTLGWGHVNYKNSNAIEIFEAIIQGKRFNERKTIEKFGY
jgi:hypothetical protein